MIMDRFYAHKKDESKKKFFFYIIYQIEPSHLPRISFNIDLNEK